MGAMQGGPAGGSHNLPTFLSFGIMQWLTGLVLDHLWDGGVVAGVRIYSLEAYRAAVTLCRTLAAGALLSACLVTETRCRNIWRVAHG